MINEKMVAIFLLGLVIGMLALGFPLIKSGGGFVPKFQAVQSDIGEIREESSIKDFNIEVIRTQLAQLEGLIE